MPIDDSMRSQVHGSSGRLWLLLGGNRWVVAGLILAIVFVAIAAILAVDPVPLEQTVDTSDPVETLFQAMLTAIITGVTLVVTINQLVLSQELGAVGDQRERMEGSLEFRENAAEKLDEPVSPAEPAAFLQALLATVTERARAVRDGAEGADLEVHHAVDDYADDLIESADIVSAELDGTEFGTFDVVEAALGFNYSLKLYGAKRIQAIYGDDAPEGERVLDDATTAALDEVIALLEEFGIAREHVKTLYFQWALVDLGRAMLYSSVPALVVTIASILALNDGSTVGGSTLWASNLAWVVLAAVTISLAPFAVLLSYVLRIATVAKHTLAIGPFVLRETDRSEDDSS